MGPLTSHQQRKTVATDVGLLEAFQEVPVPDEPRVGSLEQAHVEELRGHRVEPLERVRDVVRVAEVEIRRVQDGADHRQIRFVLVLLALVEVEQRGNIRDDVDARQPPDHLVVDESDWNAMGRDHQMIARNQIHRAEHSANLPHVECVGNLIRLDWKVN